MEFNTYYERRPSIRAVQFLSESQASEMARYLAPGIQKEEWTLRHTGMFEFSLEVGEVLMHRGDFLGELVVDGRTERVVIPFKQFQEQWQEPEWQRPSPPDQW